MNHAYADEAFAQESCTAMVLWESGQMLQCGSRKGRGADEWFTEPPNDHLACFTQSPCTCATDYR